MRKHYQQIDVIKGFAMVSVVALHSLRKETLLDTYAIYYIWQAVPLFMIIMGLNLGLTSAAKSARHIFTKRYFLKKCSRLLVPLLLVYVGAVLAGLVFWWLKGVYKLDFRLNNFIGLLPVPGPGNYFITLLLQSVLLLPLIRFCFQRWPSVTMLGLVLLEVLFLLLSYHVPLFEEDPYLYDAASPRYFSAIAFGLALAGVVAGPVRPSGILPLVALALAAAVFLYQLLYNEMVVPFIRPEWQTQQVLTFGYAAFLVLVLFRLLPAKSENPVLRFLAKLGKASYHIFLIQIMYFGLMEPEDNLVQDLLICLVLGFLFYKYEARLQVHRQIEQKTAA